MNIIISSKFVSCSVPNWSLYFYWRRDAYNNVATLVAFANLSECILMLFMFAISRLFGIISNRLFNERLSLKFCSFLVYFACLSYSDEYTHENTICSNVHSDWLSLFESSITIIALPCYQFESIVTRLTFLLFLLPRICLQRKKKQGLRI